MSYEAKQVEKDIVAGNLHYLLNKSRKKQIDLVNDLGFSQSIVSEYLNAKKYPAPDKMQKLADYFGVLKSDIMQEKPATISGAGLFEDGEYILRVIRGLNKKQAKLVRTYLEALLGEDNL